MPIMLALLMSIGGHAEVKAEGLDEIAVLHATYGNLRCEVIDLHYHLDLYLSPTD